MRRDYTLRRECQEQLIEIAGEFVWEGNYTNWNLLLYLCQHCCFCEMCCENLSAHSWGSLITPRLLLCPAPGAAQDPPHSAAMAAALPMPRAVIGHVLAKCQSCARVFPSSDTLWLTAARCWVVVLLVTEHSSGDATDLASLPGGVLGAPCSGGEVRDVDTTHPSWPQGHRAGMNILRLIGLT